MEELDPLLQLIQQGWPDHRQELPISMRPYWDLRSQLAVCNGIVYKGLYTFVLLSMCEHELKLISPITPWNGDEQTAGQGGTILARDECRN